ncbi:MAG TPA: hypothetical protein VFU63_10675 [Ktedonobacterales bacterium]|nr:hypothetical protein [Ktedonobacterales bacterium]
MDPVKTTHGMPHGWSAARQPALGDDPELPAGDELAAELCEAAIVRLDS